MCVLNVCTCGCEDTCLIGDEIACLNCGKQIKEENENG